MAEGSLDPADLQSSDRALRVFQTMRANLALAMAFSRRSTLEPENWKGDDLGFLGVKRGRDQLEAHGHAVVSILSALVFQALENYLEMKKLKPRLEDASLERFLDGLEDRCRFLAGMEKTRHAVFHVKSRRAWRNRDIAFFVQACEQRGGVSTAMAELLNLLYDFTDKCFSGDLKIWPLPTDDGSGGSTPRGSSSRTT